MYCKSVFLYSYKAALIINKFMYSLCNKYCLIGFLSIQFDWLKARQGLALMKLL